MSVVYFIAFAVIALISAFGAVASRTPIRAAMSLLAHILALAGLYISLYAHLLAAVQLIVYAGAVVVLFVFVIMLIGPTEDTAINKKGGGIARILSICLMGGVGLSIAGAVGGVMPDQPDIISCKPGMVECSQFGGVRGVAQVMYTDAAVPFELISILLLVAILGAIAVARGRSLLEGRRKASQDKAAQDSELAAQVAASSGQ